MALFTCLATLLACVSARLAIEGRVERQPIFRRLRGGSEADAQGLRGGAEADAPPPPRVMFVCRANSCRSQMAHGLFNKLTDGSSGASCGFRASELNPHAVAVMAEIGIDISEHTSNAIAEYDPSAFDAIICVCGCAAEVPGEWKVGHFEDWSLDDPPELDPGDRSVYRRVRDELKERIEALAKRLHVAGCGLGLGPLRGGQAAAAGGVRDEVKEYYGKVLQKSADLQTNACCTAVELPQEVKAAIGKVHPEVVSKYFGCGLCVPEALSGLSVLDLGCGSGRDCYVLAQLVGESGGGVGEVTARPGALQDASRNLRGVGSVVGVDMTDEQLSTARQHVAWHADAFGYARPNTDFKQGYIEDLKGIGLGDETFDVVVSNCAASLSPDTSLETCPSLGAASPPSQAWSTSLPTRRRCCARPSASSRRGERCTFPTCTPTAECLRTCATTRSSTASAWAAPSTGTTSSPWQRRRALPTRASSRPLPTALLAPPRPLARETRPALPTAARTRRSPSPTLRSRRSCAASASTRRPTGASPSCAWLPRPAPSPSLLGALPQALQAARPPRGRLRGLRAGRRVQGDAAGPRRRLRPRLAPPHRGAPPPPAAWRRAPFRTSSEPPVQAGKVFPVCGNTYHMLASTRFRQHFEYVGAHPHEAGKSAHFGIFDGCGKSLPFASASAAGAGGQCC